jgi:tRNA-splicing ligase RtcB (3'-phosphate/5'-hydroxy nucleic acid ligase)
MQIFGTHDDATRAQLVKVAERARKVALMADGHVGYVMPIGGVAAYDNAVSVVGVGFDIACGNAAIRTDKTVADLGNTGNQVTRRLTNIADEIAETLSFGVGRKNRADDAPTDDPLFEDAAWHAVPAKHRQALQVKARQQLGTVGSGNHYVDVFADETGALWVGVHFGSRGFGHTVASNFLALSQGAKWGDRVPEHEVLLPLDQPLGQDYWALMELAGRYAYAGREWVARKVVSILNAEEQELVHNHHNFAWKERHEGEDLVVVRKGATPAFPGQSGFIGGSMGDDAVIVRGVRSNDASVTDVQRGAMFSTVHGAGRVMSRTAAAGKRHRRSGKILSEGRVTPDMMESWVKEKGVLLRGGGLDESPHVYRRLPDVLAAQGATIEVLHTLRPLVVVMAGANEFDPYKD